MQTLVDDSVAEPILLGRRDVIAERVRAMGLRMNLDETVRVISKRNSASRSPKTACSRARLRNLGRDIIYRH